MRIYFDEKLSIEGLSTAFTNPAIEAGLIHCRALLGFIGLRADSKDHRKLVPRSLSRDDDLTIEHFANAAGPLRLVTPAEAVMPYKGSADGAHLALARVIHVANKGVAHSTLSLISDPNDLRLSEIASRGIRTLLVNHFYVPLGLKAPAERLSSRRRPRG